MTNCTVTCNQAQGGTGCGDTLSTNFFGPEGGSGYGGGIFNLNGTMVLDNCTVTSNSCVAGLTIDRSGPTLLGSSGGADGGAVYNLALGNKIEDGTASTATVTLIDTVLTPSCLAYLIIPLQEGYLTNSVPIDDLVNNRVDGDHTNTATVIFSGNIPALSHVDLGGALSISAATGSQSALLTAPSHCSRTNLQFAVVGVPGYAYVVQTSTDLSNWTSIVTNVAPFTCLDGSSDGLQCRFYRALYVTP
jgi:hypothetical protein